MKTSFIWLYKFYLSPKASIFPKGETLELYPSWSQELEKDAHNHCYYFMLSDWLPVISKIIEKLKV